jgi:exodeoxyribonuclease-3
MWVSPSFADKAVSHVVAEEVRGWARPSDHAPLITEFVI